MDEKMTRSTSGEVTPFVDFKNLPDTTTPVDADNLNELQIEMKQYIDTNRSIPTGGTVGQVLGKLSDTDYNVGWVDKTDGVPIGSVFPFAGTTAPEKYLICDGSEVSRSDYADLFSVIGTSFGVGDNSTTFNIPNLSGKIPVGLDTTDDDFNALGKTGGSKTHTQTLEELAPHVHGIKANTNENAVSGAGRWPWVNYDGVNRYTESAGKGQPMDIMNPYNTFNYIIKAIDG